ncbi:hypothetical protein [Sporisorium scitamineum]|uniref:Uncharacterized protein n=1 Tax=Sporisorium scitamineum TaxID=49012 RepID=A0A0F7S233_9BASI|nr:hypothetical protein [Sporisorium scitamineum]
MTHRVSLLRQLVKDQVRAIWSQGVRGMEVCTAAKLGWLTH